MVTGGLAAHAYGASRSINDIDIDMAEDDIVRVADLVRPYITFGPAHFKDEAWDTFFMRLCHDGQEIDIGGAEHTRIFDPRSGTWGACVAARGDHRMMDVLGVQLPVNSPEQLIAYKEKLAAWGQSHQEHDVAAVKAYVARELHEA